MGSAEHGESQPKPTSLRSDNPDDGSYLIQVARSAMATQFQIYLNAGQHTQGAERALEALDLVDLLEEELSVYRETSVISRLNREAHEAPQAVEPELFGLLEHSVQLSRLSDGAFDITSAPLSELWGFHRREGRLPSQSQIAETLEHVGYRHLELDARQQTVKYGTDRLQVNLGSIGKGYSLDRCERQLSEQGLSDFLMHGGHSSVLARGNRDAPGIQDRGWKIEVRHPRQPDRVLGQLWLRDQALGTSGAANQYFHHQGKRYGHILDPRTGQPADGVLSATVLAPSAAEADALATACVVLGVESAVELIQSRPPCGLLLVAPAPKGQVELIQVGLEQGQWQSHGGGD